MQWLFYRILTALLVALIELIYKDIGHGIFGLDLMFALQCQIWEI